MVTEPIVMPMHPSECNQNGSSTSHCSMLTQTEWSNMTAWRLIGTRNSLIQPWSKASSGTVEVSWLGCWWLDIVNSGECIIFSEWVHTHKVSERIQNRTGPEGHDQHSRGSRKLRKAIPYRSSLVNAARISLKITHLRSPQYMGKGSVDPQRR